MAKIDSIAELTGLGDYLSVPIRTYSSGMLVRLAFAISANITPDILAMAEIFGTVDAAFMEQAHKKMLSLLDQSSIVVMATHAESLLKDFCNKCVLLAAGANVNAQDSAGGMFFARSSINMFILYP